jgi:hypothetical protein
MPPAAKPSFFETACEIVSEQELSSSRSCPVASAQERADAPKPAPSRPPLRGFRCAECKTVTHLADLNDDMLCANCGEPEEDPEFVIDSSIVAMRREHGTWW